MKKVLNISFTLCLLAAMSSLFCSIDQSNTVAGSDVFSVPGDSLYSEQNDSIFSRSYLFLLFAEIDNNTPSEIDPHKSFSANWCIIQSERPLQLQF